VGRIRLIVLLTGVAGLLALLAPGAALAGTYAWSLPGDFTGSNPEHKYGAVSWSYQENGAMFGGGATSACGGTGFTANGDCIGSTGSTMNMTAQANRSVSIAWVNPFTSSATVMVSSSFALGGGLLACPGGGLSSTNGTVGPGTPVSVTLRGGLLTSCSASGSISILATTPPPGVSLSSPGNGSTITDAQPTFSGGASSGFGISNQVTVRVYSGSSPSGTPVQTLTTTASGGSYSVSPSSALGAGKYTAQAEQDDIGGGHGFSSPVTFTLRTSAPTVTLNSLGSNPLLTSTPTLTGTAGTRPIDSNQVTINIWSGTNINAKPVQVLTGTVSGGHYSIMVSPALPDNKYTAIASQMGGGGIGSSDPVTFTIKVNPPALTLDQPAAGASVGRTSLGFSGQAGNNPGDSSIVTVYLYRGTSTSGQLLGTARAHANGSHWSVGWPTSLALGFYTAQATQSDNAGHTSQTTPHTFLLVRNPRLVGSSATMSRSGWVTLPIGCLAPAGQTCRGTVLVVTQRSFRTSGGGPSGPLQLLFVSVRISGGTSEIVHVRAPRSVAHALRRKHRVTVIVTVKLSKSGGGRLGASVRRVLKIT
jgi:hypothetical protein